MLLASVLSAAVVLTGTAADAAKVKATNPKIKATIARTLKAPVPRAKPIVEAVTKAIAKVVEPVVKPVVKFEGRLAQWVTAADGGRAISSASIASAMAAESEWPGQLRLQLRYEQALRRESPKPEAIVAAFAGRKPVSADGTLLLADALTALDRKDEATDLIRGFWRAQDFSAGDEQAILKTYKDALTPADLWARVDRLLYEGDTDDAKRDAKLVEAPLQALVAARVAVISGNSAAAKLLDAVPEPAQTEPGYIFARAQFLRGQKKYAEAAAMMATAPTDPAKLVDADAWSIERQLLARRLLDAGDARTAYKVVADARATSQVPRVEAAFDAGWYALAFLNDPAAAAPHFQAILDNSRTPISQSRGAYWLGRVAEALGNKEEATARYKQAAAYPIAFYGQLAAARLKQTELGIGPPPTPDDAAKARFAERELVRSMITLRDAGREGDAEIFSQYLARTLSDPEELALLADMAEERGEHSSVVEIGKAAQARGVDVGTLAFPTTALPAYDGPAKVDLPVLYAIARQESTFDHSVKSSAGAVGVLQVMPQYAKEMADKAGIPYVKDKVRTDINYNMQIGAAELADLIQNYDGCYVLAFAAYNAGRGRVGEWLKAYGDPRDPSIDVVNWIERIPFSETRNYVQRALENLQVYRARFGDPALKIEADLRGGHAEPDTVSKPADEPAPAAPAAATQKAAAL